MAIVGIWGRSATRPPLDYKFSFSLQDYGRADVGSVVLSDIYTHANGDSWQLKLKKMSRYHDLGLSGWDGQLQLITMSSNDNCKLARVVWQKGINIPTEVALFCQSGQKSEFEDFDCDEDQDVMQMDVEIFKCAEAERMPKPKIEPPKSQMATEVLNWIRTEEFGDTTIVASDGQKFRCHRDVLTRRSEVFGRMFSSGMKEAREKIVKIEDFDSQIVIAVLQYLYSDDCSDLGPIADQLYAAAHQYQLDRLKILCETTLAVNLSENSLLKTQQLAEFYHMEELKATCVDYSEWHNTANVTAPANAIVNGGYSTEAVQTHFKFRFGVDNFQRWLLGSPLLINRFTHSSSTWQLELIKTGQTQVRCQLQLVATGDDCQLPKFSSIRLRGDPWSSSSLVSFRQSGDKFDFGTFDIGSTDRLKVEVVDWEARGIMPDTPPKSEMFDEVLKWFQTEDFGDTTIVAKDGMKFRCHRDILAARSDVFRSKFSGPLVDENVVKVEDFDGDIVAALLQFFYTDQSGEIGPIAARVYVAADQFKLDRLKFLCEVAMAKSLSVDSVMKVYRLATVYHLDKLLAVCADYLESHRAELPISEILAEAVKIGQGK